MDMQSSSLVSNGIAYAIDPFTAGIMLLRRDVTVEDWSDPKNRPIRRQSDYAIWLRNTAKRSVSQNGQHKNCPVINVRRRKA